MINGAILPVVVAWTTLAPKHADGSPNNLPAPVTEAGTLLAMASAHAAAAVWARRQRG
jgi:hypothetical protein